MSGDKSPDNPVTINLRKKRTEEVKHEKTYNGDVYSRSFWG